MSLVFIALCRVAQFLIAFAMLRVATTLLSPEEMGKVALIMSTIAFFAMFMVNPVGMFINRRLHAWEANGTARAHLERYVFYLICVALMSVFSLTLFDLNGLVNFGMSIVWIVTLVSTSLIFNTINQTSIPSLNMLGYSRSFVVLSLATLVTSFVCAVTLVQTMQATAEYWVLGLLLGQVLLAMVGAKMLFSKLRKTNSLNTKSPTIRGLQHQVLFDFAWPVALAAGFSWVQMQGYRYFMESYLGLANLGLFVAGYSISSGIIASFESILTTYFQPRLYQEVSKDHPEEQAKAWKRYASAVIPPLLLTATLVVLLAPELTKILMGERFQEAAKFVVWGVLAESARVLVGAYSMIAHVYMRTRWLILPSLVGASLSIMLCVTLMPLLGAHGAGIAMCLAGFVVVALSHILLAKRAGGGIPMRPLGLSVLSAGLLCIAVMAIRALINTADNVELIGFIVLSGLIYIILLHGLLRNYLAKKL